MFWFGMVCNMCKSCFAIFGQICAYSKQLCMCLQTVQRLRCQLARFMYKFTSFGLHCLQTFAAFTNVVCRCCNTCFAMFCEIVFCVQTCKLGFANFANLLCPCAHFVCKAANWGCILSRLGVIVCVCRCCVANSKLGLARCMLSVQNC